jgi:S-DNA-T family DNA segregation ATPase FtsK/SpoIIIE
MKKRKKTTGTKYGTQAASILLICFGLFLFLSLISYNRTDNPDLELTANSIEIKNLFGRFGAAVADPLIKYTLGFPILVLPLLIIFSGVLFFQRKKIETHLRGILLLVLWAMLISVFLALSEAIETGGAIREYYPSGLIGGEIASLLVLYLGTFGTLIVLFMTTLSISIITFHIDIPGILNRTAQWIRQVSNEIMEGFRQWRIKRHRIRKQAVVAKTVPKIPVKQPEIRTSFEPESEPDSETEEEMILPEESTEDRIPMIKTTLDELLARTDSASVDTTLLSPPGFEHQEQTEEVDFEVKEEVTEEEVDYDKLVRDSVAKYKFPSVDLLEDVVTEDTAVTRQELEINAELLEAKLLDFGLKAKVIRVVAGPVITLYELQPAPGVKVSQIVSLANDLALAMEAKGIRMVAPIPGRAAIGIEIPNRNPQIVYLKPLIRSEKFAQSTAALPIALGKMINGSVYCSDLTKMPHLLIAGSTGSGKSVGINTIIASLLYRVDPGKVKFVMIDPKKIELSLYRPLRDHYLVWRSDLDEEVITKPSNVVSILNSIVLEMELRYDKLAHLGVRGIDDYNERVRMGGPRVKEEKLQQLPYLVVIIDELADLMLMAAKEIETPITRLAQMARAVGIHLILATQRPSVDVITGVIKANFPARIAYMVTTRPDSKTILDTVGAEQLLGNGDMLFMPPGEPRAIRLQNPLITTQEVERIIKHIRSQPKLPHYTLPQPTERALSSNGFGDFNGQDTLYEEARQIVVQHQQGSISLLQRRLKIGYSRAARLIDQMEEEGIVGPADGSKPRQVYFLPDEL